MKKYILTAVGIIVLIAAGFGFIFYRNNLRGVRPIISGPATRNTPEAGVVGTNTTGIPFVLPTGFSIKIYKDNLPGARVLTFDPMGRMVVSLAKSGKIVALTDTNNDGTADTETAIVSSLNSPHGIAFNCPDTSSCTLLVAETAQVTSYSYNIKDATASNRKKILDLPNDGGHSTRTLLLIDTPEGKRLLTAIGSSCNVCTEKDTRRAAIYISKLDGTDFKPYATGLRNSVFMTPNPITGEVWATEMGRDLLGDNTPPDEVNIIKADNNYGWPICYGQSIHDTSFDKSTYIQNPCNNTLPAHIDLQAHSAPLGLAFIPEEGWPEALRHDLLIAYHGSWNRSTPTGYKIVKFDLDDTGQVQGTNDFLTGFLKPDNKSAYGRPVDILVQPGGIMYISDDHAGLIYRMEYSAETNSK